MPEKTSSIDGLTESQGIAAKANEFFNLIDSDNAFSGIAFPSGLTSTSNISRLVRAAIYQKGAATASLAGQLEVDEIVSALQSFVGDGVDLNKITDLLNVKEKANSKVSIAIQNAGFEDPAQEDFTFTVEPPPGWQVYDPNNIIPEVTTEDSSATGVFNPSLDNYPGGVPEGNNVGYSFLVQAPGSGEAGLSQTLDTLLAPNTRYTLSVAVGNPTGDDPVPGISFPGFSGYRVELLAGGQVLAVDDNSLNIPEGKFKTSKITYTSSATDSVVGQPLEIRLINLLQGPGIEVDFDDVQLTAKALPGGSKSSHGNATSGDLFNQLHQPSTFELPLAPTDSSSLFG
ncbi:MAG: hypothetical protein KME12_21460 [Trichocoleus desertorum ATA4-8-CV12]|jgi:hypothetical protein|nr:hypothetical protein [Trichocoleus desertorum ATA4-8-CV12]